MVRIDEVPLVPETHRVPLELRQNRQRHVEALAVEDERAPDGRFFLVPDGNELVAELVLLPGAERDPQLRERVVLEVKLLDEINLVARDPQSFAGDEQGRRRGEQRAGNFHAIGFPGRGFRQGLILRRGGYASRSTPRHTDIDTPLRRFIDWSRPGLSHERARPRAGLWERPRLKRTLQPPLQSTRTRQLDTARGTDGGADSPAPDLRSHPSHSSQSRRSRRKISEFRICLAAAIRISGFRLRRAERVVSRLTSAVTDPDAQFG